MLAAAMPDVLVGEVDAALLALVDGRRAAGAGVVGVGSLVGDVARVDLFADDSPHDRGRRAAGLLDVSDGERAGGDGAADLVGADPDAARSTPARCCDGCVACCRW